MSRRLFLILVSCFFSISLYAQLLKTDLYEVYPAYVGDAIIGAELKIVFCFSDSIEVLQAELQVQNQSVLIKPASTTITIRLESDLKKKKRGSPNTELGFPIVLLGTKAGEKFKSLDTLWIKAQAAKASLVFGGKPSGHIAYRNCGNIIQINSISLPVKPDSFYMVPDGALWKPGSEQLIVRNKRVKNRFFMIPENNQKLIFDYGYYTSGGKKVSLGMDYLIVQPPPRPTIELWVGDSLWDGNPVARDAQLRLAAVPREDFREERPQDARYELKNIQMRWISKYPKASGPLYLPSQEIPEPMQTIEKSKPIRLPAEIDILGMGKAAFGIAFSPKEAGVRKSGILLIEIGEILRVNIENKMFPESFFPHELWLEVPVN